MSTSKETSASNHLDLIRGLAALAVVVFHVRYRFFFDFHDVADPSLLQKAFYVATAFGHDAVMVFFVLSGYFISSSIIRDCRQQRWSWSRYLVNRTTRLYVVLIPGLLLTLFWDQLGMSCFGDHPIYSGEVRTWQAGYGFSVPDRSTAKVFFGNILFLQAIKLPPFGSNDALWSLSYEFWYYVLFPCLWLGLIAVSTWRARIACGAMAVATCLVVNREVLLHFPIWLLGTAVCLLPRGGLRRSRTRFFITLASAMTFSLALLVAHSGVARRLVSEPGLLTDYCTAFGFTLLLYSLIQNPSPSSGGLYARVATFLAGCSYTLYVVHMPLLTFLRAALTRPEPWSPDAMSVALGGVIVMVVLAYAILVWYVTEARTAVVRDAVTGFVGSAMGGLRNGMLKTFLRRPAAAGSQAPQLDRVPLPEAEGL